MLLSSLRRGIGAVFVLLILLFGGLAAISIGAPLVGYEAVIVRGGSMAPALPSGSLALVNRGETDPHPGSIVTVRRGGNVLVTHRVVGVTDGEPPLFQLKGDANEHPDARPVPIGSIVGVVTHHVPVAGFLAFMLRQPTGLVAIVSLLASLLLATRLLEDEVDEALVGGEGTSAAPPVARSIGAAVLALCLLAGGLVAPMVAHAVFASSPADSSTFSSAPSW